MKQFAVFRLGGEEFGVDIFKVIEILNPVRRYSIPDMPGFFSGVISLRGAVIPLIDLRRRFNLKSRPDRERIIVVRVGGQRAGLCVDSVTEITSFADSDIVPPPPIFRGFKPEFLLGLGKKGERVIVLLDADMILTSEERAVLRVAENLMEVAADGHYARTAP